ncbi:MAG: hypothetical protein IJU48_02760 [Synergistaceae bacterium]|nr:hypothetical protein [Synergistaceae bacterium]
MADKLYQTYNFEISRTDNGIYRASFDIWSDDPRGPEKYSLGNSVNFIPDEIMPNPYERSKNPGKYPAQLGYKIFITKKTTTDEKIGELCNYPYRLWHHQYEGYLILPESGGEFPSQISYSVDIERNDDGESVYSGTMTVTQAFEPETPDATQIDLLYQIGDTFTIPLYEGISLTCTKISTSNSYNDYGLEVITTVYEGKLTADEDGTFELPAEEITDITHELNGLTVRTIAGELIALRRSTTPITRKTLTAYSQSSEPFYALGSESNGGIVLSDKVIKETKEIRNSRTGKLETQIYYRHEIEVEA